MANWHLDQNGRRIGPITQDVLMQMVNAGHVSASDLVWTERMQNWQPAGMQSWFPGATPSAMMPQTGPAPGGGGIFSPPAPPPNLLVWAILEIFCCCLITGIIGLVYDSKAKTEYARGNYAGAQDAYNTGKIWLIAGAILGVAGS
jgi:hypothetical protein